MDQEDSNLRDDMIQSSEAFSEQFDPTNPNFHGGVKTPVPIGGVRVPESMPTVYPENVKDLNSYISAPQPVFYGEEYEQVQATREFFNVKLKKTLASLSIAVESLFRHRDLYKSHQSEPEKAKQIFEKNMQKDEPKLKIHVEDLTQCIKFLDQKQAYKDRYSELHQILKTSQEEIQTKEQLAEFNFAVKKISTLSFKDCSLLLDRMKQIKKQYEQSQKQSQVNQEEQKA